MAKGTCSIDGCENPVWARGFCSTHYQRWRLHGDLNRGRPIQPQQVTSCSIDGCDKPAVTKGWCAMHYQRWRVHGDPTVTLHPARVEYGDCTVEGCERKEERHGLCSMHLWRLRHKGDVGPANSTRRGRGTGAIRNSYLLVPVRGHPLAHSTGYAYAHRVVLYEHIGPGEHECHWCNTVVSWDVTPPAAGGLCVDHVNFDKLDNRPVNLVPACFDCNIRRRSPEEVAEL